MTVTERYLRCLWMNFNKSRIRRGGRTVSFATYKRMKATGTVAKGRPVKHYMPVTATAPEQPPGHPSWSYAAWAATRPITDRDRDRAWDSIADECA